MAVVDFVVTACGNDQAGEQSEECDSAIGEKHGSSVEMRSVCDDSDDYRSSATKLTSFSRIDRVRRAARFGDGPHGGPYASSFLIYANLRVSRNPAAANTSAQRLYHRTIGKMRRDTRRRRHGAARVRYMSTCPMPRLLVGLCATPMGPNPLRCIVMGKSRNFSIFVSDHDAFRGVAEQDFSRKSGGRSGPSRL